MELNPVFVDSNLSIKSVANIIDRSRLGLALVNKGSDFLGIVTDGDIRRAILMGMDIKETVSKITNKQPVIIKEGDLGNKKLIEELSIYVNGRNMLVPVLDEKSRVKYILPFSDIFNSIRSNRERYDVSKVLVVGGAGYMGSVLCRKLLASGYKVRVLDNLLYGEEPVKELLLDKNFELIRGDIRNVGDIAKAIIGMDAVVHLAAIVGDQACDLNTETTTEINVLATRTIAELCKHYQINRFIFASSCSVYGKGSSDILTEESPLNPVSYYAQTKIRSEQEIMKLKDDNFMPIILRKGTLYGRSPRMRFDLYVNLFTAKAAQEGKLTVFGGQQRRPNLSVSDAADAYIACLEAPIENVGGEIFNVGDQNLKIAEVADVVAGAVGNVNVEVTQQITDERDYFVDCSKFKKAIGYLQTHWIKENVLGMKRMFDEGAVKDYKEDRYANIKSLFKSPELQKKRYTIGYFS